MTDVFSEAKRSYIMGQVKGKDTKPELLVRSMVHRMGFRFRLHRKDLPGAPDIVLPKHMKTIFVHGCFWHGHEGCPRSARPTTRPAFWKKKLDGNMRRDTENVRHLTDMGWKVLVVWQCEMRNRTTLQAKLQAFLNED